MTSTSNEQCGRRQSCGTSVLPTSISPAPIKPPMVSYAMTSTRPAADDLPLKACRHCGAIQHLPPKRSGTHAVCHRCEAPLATEVSSRISRQRTLAAALAAFLLYIPAITLPLLRIRQLGH